MSEPKQVRKQYRSAALATVHETMQAMHHVGAVGKQTMRGFDDACLTQVRALRPKEIKRLFVGGCPYDR